ncbi:hypothetical protein ACWCQJ_13825 [Streptomyces olivaceus]|uniref:hypothetical protein n=1 Tax=Streptomyces sp. VN1 TaxID=1821625 RepID=UPI001413E6ED|nr:hypothetical protein [Streptomyces sp. VN1]QIP71487.1 hypothetical protein EZV63_17830 [Streptomyces sp. VN1]
MSNNLKRLSVASAALAAALVATSAGSAEAAGAQAQASCNVSGASGVGNFKNWTNNYADMSLTVKDTSSDGNSVAIRLISKDDNDKTKYWSWHSNANGYNKSVTWNTHASTGSGGLSYIGIQAAVIKNSAVVRYCTDWAS